MGQEPGNRQADQRDAQHADDGEAEFIRQMQIIVEIKNELRPWMGFFGHDLTGAIGQDCSCIGRQDDARQILSRQLNKKMGRRRFLSRQHGKSRTFCGMGRDGRHFRRPRLFPSLEFMVENRNCPADGQDIEKCRGGEA